MKIQIRKSVFETNSSSVHSITICSARDYCRWIKGKLWYDRYNGCLVDSKLEEEDDEDYPRYLTFKQFNDCEYIEHETYKETYTTENGEQVVAFGYYGHD